MMTMREQKSVREMAQFEQRMQDATPTQEDLQDRMETAKVQAHRGRIYHSLYQEKQRLMEEITQ
jgi:hypothetical protein